MNAELKERARKKAQQSCCAFQVGALGFNARGELVAQEFNRNRFLRAGGGLHAEQLIMRYARKKGIRHIVVCRVGKSGDFRPIEPCAKCQKMANALKIKIDVVSP